MGKQCFTCSHKISRELSKLEKSEWLIKFVEKTGRKTIFVPNMEFTCDVSGEKIQQIDPACEHYVGDKMMEDIRKDISLTAKKLREGL